MNSPVELRALARQALLQYDIVAARIRLASRSTNAIYRITSVDGQAYALRLATPGWRTLLDLQSEALWLEALARDTRIGAPAIMRTRAGDAVVALSGGVHATLMDWLPGHLKTQSGAFDCTTSPWPCLICKRPLAMNAIRACWQPFALATAIIWTGPTVT